MAMGKFPERTIIVELGKLRPFSDVIGRLVIRIDNSSQKRQDIANRLETAGCTKASLLNECLNELGIQNLGNLASNLQKYPQIFRKRGSGKATEYKLTTADGRTSARRIMHKLAKGEPLDEN